ncbi:MAG: response regulator [Spirosomataceae bacterium]
MNQPLRILIVEDELLTALAIEEHLSEAGYAVCGKAADHAAALDLMRKEVPDLVLIDVHLGDGETDGIVTARDLTRIKPIPIIYLTARTDLQAFERAKGTKPLAYLLKPFRPSELAMQVELALQNFYEGETAAVVGMSDHLYVPEGQNKLLRVNHAGILLLKAEGPYSEFFLTEAEFSRLYPEKIYRTEKPILMSVGFGHLLSNLPENFYKVSRSLAINLDYLDRVEYSRVFVAGCEVTLPEGGHKALMDRLNIIRSRKKK